jgi:hypothetical protein
MAATESLVAHLNRLITITLATNSFCSLNAELLEPRHQLRLAVFVRRFAITRPVVGEEGGLRTDQAKRLKNLEKENARLKRLSGLFVRRGVPVHIRSDNGSEFTAKRVREGLSVVRVFVASGRALSRPPFPPPHQAGKARSGDR